ncbi:hypothetical protein [Nocardia sp. NBC_00403]|uniref:hypothetical protein n=1 Tax=Nocardia sp. NBC_00403 TaxID=2975990 RepID=UPI003FA60246
MVDYLAAVTASHQQTGGGLCLSEVDEYWQEIRSGLEKADIPLHHVVLGGSGSKGRAWALIRSFGRPPRAVVTAMVSRGIQLDEVPLLCDELSSGALCLVCRPDAPATNRLINIPTHSLATDAMDMFQKSA